MQSTTTEFLTAADSSLRKPIGKLEITWSDAYVEPITSVVVISDNRGSQKEQVADNIINSSYKYTLLDGTWSLNQDYHLAPETATEIANNQIGYYGNEISNSSTPYAFTTPEVVTVNFSARTIQGVYISFDKLLNQYATNYTIQIYAGVTLLFTINDSSNTEVEKYFAGQYLDVTQLVLTIRNWSTGDTCCKVTEFFTSFVTTHESNDIISMNLLEEREIRESTLPIGNISSNELTFTIQNYDYGYNEWVQADEVKVVKSNVQGARQWSVYRIINGGTPTLIDTYYCPSSTKLGSTIYSFVYFYTIPNTVVTNDTVQLYFIPSGADVGNADPFLSDLWTVNNIIYDPYNPDNPNSIFKNFIKPNRRIRAYLGFILDNGSYNYLSIGSFWTNDWQLNDDKLSITTDCRDRLGLLQDNIYDGSPLFENRSLYYITNTILTYAKTYIPMNDLQWSIDTELSSIVIPYAYFDKISYFDVLKQIVQACLGQCYMSKDDILIIESYTKNLNIDAPTTVLTKDSYYNINQKFSFIEILNQINVNYFIFSLASSTAFYTSSAIGIAANETLAPITINYSNPVKDTTANAALINLTGGIAVSKVTEYYYSWGCIIEVQETNGSSGTFQIQVTGEELIESDKISKTTEDTNSITEFGTMKYDFPDNILVQNEALAISIGENLIDTYSNPRNEITINYAGNPAIELSDTITVTVYKRGLDNILKDYIIYKNELNFDGTLMGTLYGKLQTYTGVMGDEVQNSDNATSINLYQDADGASTEWQDTDK